MSSTTAGNRSTEPLYRRVYEELLEEFQGADWGEPRKLPSENELCERYCTSRRTVRMAVDLLIKRGLVERVPGKGSFVVDPQRQGTDKNVCSVVLFWPEVDLPDGELLGFARTLSGLRSVFRDSNILHETLPGNAADFVALSERLTGKVDGLVVTSPPKGLQKVLSKQELPLVVTGHVLPQIELPYVCFNLFKMGYEAAHQILKRRHRKFGSITADLENVGSQRFLAGVQQALFDFHLPATVELHYAARHFDEYLRVVDQAVAEGASCLILLDPEYAGAVHHHLLEKGCRVPDDISLVVLEMFKNMTLRPPFYSGFPADRTNFGIRCGELLMRLIKKEQLDPSESHIVINLEFFQGKTLKDFSSPTP